MEYFEPNFIDEALILLERYAAGARILAGGTRLGPELRAHVRGVDALVNVKRIPELFGIAVADDILTIGALVNARDLAENPLVRRHAPLIADAAQALGVRQLRNVATVGGNVCSRDPAADLAVALLASDARCLISSMRDRQLLIQIESFFRPGSNALAPGDLLTALEVPCSNARVAYVKMQTRRAFEMAIVAVAVRVVLDDVSVRDIRIVLGGAAPTPVRATAAEASILGQILDEQSARAAARVAADADADPTSDQHASAEYRRHLVAILTERALRLAHGRPEGRPLEDEA